MISLNLSSSSSSSSSSASSVSSSSSQPGASADASPPQVGEFDWRSAYLRVQSQHGQQQDTAYQDTPPAPLQPVDPLVQPLPLQPLPLREPQPLGVAPLAPTVTAQRVEALRALDPMPALGTDPAARVWQVELPTLQPGWQLRVEQLQPQAPLRLDLCVPAVLQTQARRQLADLDKRLRDAGHDVLGSRLQDSPRARPPRVDEVQS